jgi:hypothetical protein
VEQQAKGERAAEEERREYYDARRVRYRFLRRL